MGAGDVDPEEKFTDPIKLTIPQDFHLPECCHALMRDLVQVCCSNSSLFVEYTLPSRVHGSVSRHCGSVGLPLYVVWRCCSHGIAHP